MFAIAKRYLLTCISPLWSLIWKLRGVRIGCRCTFIGRAGLNRKSGSIIQLGKQVTLCSSPMANPLSEIGRCRLATLDKHARLVIHDMVGMSSTTICCAKSIVIGQGTQIGGGVLIMDTDFHPRNSDSSWATDPAAVSKPVTIGQYCFIGARAIILKGVQIGNGAVIGAGSVVTKNVPEGAVACGNPATIKNLIRDV